MIVIILNLVLIVKIETNYLYPATPPATTHHHPAFPSQRGGGVVSYCRKGEKRALTGSIPPLDVLIKSKV